MAQGPTEERRKLELVAKLDASRQRIQSGRQAVSDKLHPVRRFRHAVSSKPLQAFSIAAGSAFLLSLLRRRNKASKPPSLKRFLFRSAFNLAKPALRLWLLNQAKDRFLNPERKQPGVYEANTP